MLRRILPVMFLAALLCDWASMPALAQSFPSKTVRMVVPYPAGGSTDALARALASSLGTAWSQSVVVENIAGAGSIIGAEKVATASPDGHTLLFTIGTTVVANRFLYKKLPFDPDKGLAPITMIAQSGLFVIVNPSVPANTFRELVEAARRAPNGIAYCSSGVGSPQHLAFGLIAKREAVQFLHVPYKGEAPCVSAVVSGEAQTAVATLSATSGMVKAGKLKAIAIGGARRSNLFPEVPTMRESGYPYAVVEVWFGLFAPGGANAQLVDRIYRDATAAIKRAEFAEKYLNPYGLNVIASSPAEFTAAIRAEVAITAEMVKAADIKPE